MKAKSTVSDLAARLRTLMDFQPIDPSQTYTIGELASHLRVSLRTLRFYEQKGLIASTGRRGLRRTFAPAVLERLSLVALGRAAGFSLDEIAGMFTPEIGRAHV